MLPPAPGLLSTMKGWPKTRCSSGASARARMSVVPPAAKGTTMRTGLLGHALWAAATSGDSSAAAASARRKGEWVAMALSFSASEAASVHEAAAQGSWGLLGPVARRTRDVCWFDGQPRRAALPLDL